MRVLERFRLERDANDPPWSAALTDRLEAAGIELGADVTLWYCAACDFARADFDYEGKR